MAGRLARQPDDRNDVFPELSRWMNATRGMAVGAIVLHHWLLFMPCRGSEALDFIKTAAGDFVHLFFVLSGCGLTASYWSKGSDWREWLRRRFTKVVLPFWLIVLFTFLLKNALHFLFPARAAAHSWLALLAHLTFMRNFYPPAWALNGVLWFMPVIVGLYALFPLLVKLLETRGAFFLMTTAACVAYASILLFHFIGYPSTCQAALPLFHLAEFSFGMLIGRLFIRRPCFRTRASRLLTVPSGASLYGAAWFLRENYAWGWVPYDVSVAIGLFLITFGASLRLKEDNYPCAVLMRLSSASYVIYLTHGPVLLLLMRPLLKDATAALHGFSMLASGTIFCFLMLLIARIFSACGAWASRRLARAPRLAFLSGTR